MYSKPRAIFCRAVCKAFAGSTRAAMPKKLQGISAMAGQSGKEDVVLLPVLKQNRDLKAPAFLKIRRCESLGLVNDARAALNHLVVVWQAVQRLGCTQEQVATRLQGGVDKQQDGRPYFSGKVDQHVAAKDDVELAQAGITVQQVERTKLHAALDRCLDGPAARRLEIEVTLQALGRKTPGNCQAVVLTRFAVGEHRPRKVRCHNLHP